MVDEPRFLNTAADAFSSLRLYAEIGNILTSRSGRVLRKKFPYYLSFDPARANDLETHAHGI